MELSGAPIQIGWYQWEQEPRNSRMFEYISVHLTSGRAKILVERRGRMLLRAGYSGEWKTGEAAFKQAQSGESEPRLHSAKVGIE
jgi:hypothetical protein